MSTSLTSPLSPIAVRSSWIQSILYKRTPDGCTYIAAFLKLQDRKDTPVALLYGGPQSPVPYYLPGLLSAHKSPGRAYNLLLKGKYEYQRVEGKSKVAELRRMMK